MKAANPLFLDSEDWTLLRTLLSKYEGPIYAFGSRVKGTHSKFSDIDLYITSQIDTIQLAEDFYDSDLSVKVDIKTPYHCDEAFYELIKNDFVLIKQ